MAMKAAAAKAARIAKVAAGMGGIQTGTVKMQKAQLVVIDPKYAVSKAGYKSAGVESEDRYVLYCQFNPETIAVKKEVEWNTAGGDDPDDATPAAWTHEQDGNGKWISKYKPANAGTQPNKNTPQLEFGGGKPASFGLDLFFDTSDQEPGSDDRDVRRYTNDLLMLTLGDYDDKKKGVNQPPPVMFVWGKFVLFEAVIESVEITYILFDSDGTPVRAKASVGFIQHDPLGLDNEYKYQNPTTRTEPRKTWIVRQGQTVHQIADAEYGHPSYWRHVADSNNLLNPLKLRPGQVLVLPPLP